MKDKKTRKNTPALDKARVLELLASNPGANKRDLAKLLGLKGSDRIHLKRVLKELEQDGAIEGSRKSGLTRRGELPDITVIEVTGTDADGEALARPLQWGSDEKPPVIYLIPPKDGGAPASGARLLAKLERHGGHYEARILRKLDSEAQAVLTAVLAALANDKQMQADLTRFAHACCAPQRLVMPEGVPAPRPVPQTA